MGVNITEYRWNNATYTTLWTNIRSRVMRLASRGAQATTLGCDILHLFPPLELFEGQCRAPSREKFKFIGNMDGSERN